jgi:hypothetical protein
MIPSSMCASAGFHIRKLHPAIIPALCSLSELPLLVVGDNDHTSFVVCPSFGLVSSADTFTDTL